MKQVERLYIRALWLTSLGLFLYLVASHKLNAFQERPSVAERATRTQAMR